MYNCPDDADQWPVSTESFKQQTPAPGIIGQWVSESETSNYNNQSWALATVRAVQSNLGFLLVSKAEPASSLSSDWPGGCEAWEWEGVIIIIGEGDLWWLASRDHFVSHTWLLIENCPKGPRNKGESKNIYFKYLLTRTMGDLEAEISSTGDTSDHYCGQAINTMLKGERRGI